MPKTFFVNTTHIPSVDIGVYATKCDKSIDELVDLYPTLDIILITPKISLYRDGFSARFHIQKNAIISNVETEKYKRISRTSEYDAPDFYTKLNFIHHDAFFYKEEIYKSIIACIVEMLRRDIDYTRYKDFSFFTPDMARLLKIDVNNDSLEEISPKSNYDYYYSEHNSPVCTLPNDYEGTYFFTNRFFYRYMGKFRKFESVPIDVISLRPKGLENVPVEYK